MKRKLLHAGNMPLKTHITYYQNSQYFLDIRRQNSRLDEILFEMVAFFLGLHSPKKYCLYLHSGTFPFQRSIHVRQSPLSSVLANKAWGKLAKSGVSASQ